MKEKILASDWEIRSIQYAVSIPCPKCDKSIDFVVNGEPTGNTYEAECPYCATKFDVVGV